MRAQENLPPLERPLEQTSQGGRTAGLIGPVFLLTPLAFLALRFAAGRQLMLAAAIFLLPALTNLQTRFLMPALPFVSLALGMALMDARAAVWLLLIFDAITCWPTFTGNYCTDYAWRLTRFPLQEALRTIPESTTLHSRMGWMAMVDLIEEKVPPDARLLSFGDLPQAYMTRNVMVDYQSAFAQKMTDILSCASVEGNRPTRIMKFTFPALSLRRVRALQTVRGTDQWSIAEFRIYRAGRELARTPEWRISAIPNPFDAALAFDNNPATRWSSEQEIYSGMRVEVDLGSAKDMDSVVLESSHDQWNAKVRVEGETAPGVWRMLADKASEADRESDLDLRRMAIAEVRARGVTHLMVSNDNTGAVDFEKNARRWGLELVGAAAGGRLYRLDP